MQEAALVEATFGVSAKLVCHSNYTAVRQVWATTRRTTKSHNPLFANHFSARTARLIRALTDAAIATEMQALQSSHQFARGRVGGERLGETQGAGAAGVPGLPLPAQGRHGVRGLPCRIPVRSPVAGRHLACPLHQQHRAAQWRALHAMCAGPALPTWQLPASTRPWRLRLRPLPPLPVRPALASLLHNHLSLFPHPPVPLRLAPSSVALCTALTPPSLGLLCGAHAQVQSSVVLHAFSMQPGVGGWRRPGMQCPMPNVTMQCPAGTFCGRGAVGPTTCSYVDLLETDPWTVVPTLQRTVREHVYLMGDPMAGNYCPSVRYISSSTTSQHF